MSTIYREIQDALREELVRSVGRNRWRLWFRDVDVTHVDEHSLRLAVPTHVHKTWLEYTYAAELNQACIQVLGEGVGIELTVSRTQDAKRSLRDRLPEQPSGWRRLLEGRIPEPTLDGFVAQGHGRFPVMLLRQALVGGGTSANNIYLFGEAGSGKSHLLTAFTRGAEQGKPGAAYYQSLQEFTQRFVAALRSQDASAVRAFRAHLEGRRFVVIDGLERLQGRAATEQELVRLLDVSQQLPLTLILAGRRHPRELEGVGERLRCRLLGGVTARLSTPTGSLLEQVLCERALRIGMELPESVMSSVLRRSASVHGAVALLDRWAVGSLEVGAPLPANWLEELAPGAAGSTADEIVRRAKQLAADHYGVPRSQFDRPTKSRQARTPRMVAMYLVYRACALPLKEIGRAFGLRSHASVSRAIQQIRELRDVDPGLEQVIEGLLVRL